MVPPLFKSAVSGRPSTASDATKAEDGSRWTTAGRSCAAARTSSDAGADYGKVVSDGESVWRAGANDTTRLTTERTLIFGKTVLKPGVYNVFVELKENAWTLVMSTQPVQPKYDPNDKVLLVRLVQLRPEVRRPADADAPVELADEHRAVHDQFRGRHEHARVHGHVMGPDGRDD